jgi:HSP20 family molecular chaperone IbpA
MLRHFACAALALVLLAGAVPAQVTKPARPKATLGKIKKIDAKNGVLILTVKKDEEDKEVTIKLGDEAKFITISQAAKKELSAEEAAKADAFKPGTSVNVFKGPEGEVRVMAGGPLNFPRPEAGGFGKPIAGKIKEVDADKGTLTVTIKENGKEKDKEFKVGKDTRVMVIGSKGAVGKPGKDGLKAKQVKAGADVHLQIGAEGKLVMVMVGDPSAFLHRPPDRKNMVMGKIKSVDTDNGTLTITVGKKDKEFKVQSDTRVMVFSGEGRPSISKGKAGLKSKQVKAGATVHLHVDDDGHLRGILVGGPNPFIPERPIGIPSASTVKKVDAEKGTLTVTMKEEGKEKEVDFKIDKDTNFQIFSGAGRPKMYKGTKGLKELKKGTQVRVIKDPQGKVRMVMVTPKPTRPEPEDGNDEPEKPVKKGAVIEGTIKAADADEGELTLKPAKGDKKEVKVKVTEKTKFVSGTKDDKKEVTGTKGLKADSFKDGSEVTVVVNPDGSAKTVTAKPAKGKLEKDE